MPRARSLSSDLGCAHPKPKSPLSPLHSYSFGRTPRFSRNWPQDSSITPLFLYRCGSVTKQSTSSPLKSYTSARSGRGAGIPDDSPSMTKGLSAHSRYVVTSLLHYFLLLNSSRVL